MQDGWGLEERLLRLERQAAFKEDPRGDAALTERIVEVHKRSRETYGYPRVHAELRALGVRCGWRRVARLMRKAGIRGCMRGKKKRTTRRDPRSTTAPDLVNRDFRASAPDRLWTADITYVKTDEGFLHLAFVLNVCSRRLVGWSMASHLRIEFVVDAPEMAVWRRKPAAGLVHHSDRGIQHMALSFGKRLEEAGIVPSMERTGSALDDAISESFIATLKVELVHTCHFLTRGAERSAVFEYLEALYSRRRLHYSLGYVSPEGFEDLMAKEEVAVA